eukprot:1061960-Rhodomonas_salina.1
MGLEAGGSVCGDGGRRGQRVTGECNGAVTVLQVRNGESKQGASAELSLARSDLEIEQESGH